MHLDCLLMEVVNHANHPLQPPDQSQLTEFWPEENPGIHQENFMFKDLPDQSARKILAWSIH